VHQLLTDQKMDAAILQGKDYGETFDVLESGKAAAMALDDVLLYGLRANSAQPDSLAVVGQTLQIEPYGCMVRKDDTAFKSLVDKAIVKLMKSGEFEKLYTKWFQPPIPPKGINLTMPMSTSLRNNLTEMSDQPAF
jgi:glutamate/aspartate transport system substrate-binding protein